MPVSTQRKFTRTSPSIACDKSTTPPTPPNPTNALSKVLLHPPKNFWEGRVEGRSLGEGAVKIAAQSEPICDAVPFTLSELRSTLPPRESEGLVYSPSQKPFGRVGWSLRSLGEGSLKSPTARGHLCIAMHFTSWSSARQGDTCLPVGVSHRPQCAARPKPGRAAQDRLGRALLRPSSPANSTQIVEVRRHAIKNPGGLGAGPQVTQEPNTKNPKNQLAICLFDRLQFTA